MAPESPGRSEFHAAAVDASIVAASLLAAFARSTSRPRRLATGLVADALGVAIVGLELVILHESVDQLGVWIHGCKPAVGCR